MSADDSEDPMRIAASLISKLCDECITPQEADRLDLLVRSNRKVRQFYVQMMHLQCGLHEYASVLGVPTDVQMDSEPSDASSNMNETMVVPALHEPVEENPTEDVQPPTIEVPKPKKANNTKYVVWSSIAATIFVGMSIFWHFSGSNVKPIDGAPRPLARVTNDVSPPPKIAAEVPAIASLTQLAGAVWEDTHAMAAGQKLHAGDEIWLQKGCVEIAFASDRRAILEGPARLRLDSGSEVFLAYGQIAATIHGGGFEVKSPSGVLKDLGTQFGVAVERDGSTQVEVFEGSVVTESQSATTQAATTQPAGLTLSAGQAAVISHAAVVIDPRGAEPQRFVTRLSTNLPALDLVDLVSGGDGSTHRRSGGIDALTGESGLLTSVNQRTGDWKIHSVPALPVIDCAFVPDGTKGLMPIDSAGHAFEFPQTSNISINRIWAAGEIPWFNTNGISTVLDGVNYSAAPHGLLCIHSNNGLTVDLQAIRRLYPDRVVSSFHCRIGNSYVNGTQNETAVDPLADVFVIMDGKSRFDKRRFTHRDGIFNVDVPIDAADRFLTLATTDGGDGINDDWVLWVDPVLSLASRP